MSELPNYSPKLISSNFNILCFFKSPPPLCSLIFHYLSNLLFSRRMQMKKTALFILLTFHMLGMQAQQLQATLHHYTTEDGLPSNTIADIIQDKFGFIWIATWNGLSRFDGRHFVNYTTGSQSGVPHLHNRILNLCSDQKGDIWMHMYDNRVFKLNRKTDKIEPMYGGQKVDRFQSQYEANSTRGGKRYKDRQGIEWYTTLEPGVFRFNPKDGTTKHFSQEVPEPHSDNNGATIFENGDLLWISMNHGGFGYYDRQSDEIRYFYNKPGNTLSLSNTVTTFLPLKEGVIWMSTNRRGLEKLELMNERIKRWLPQAASSTFGTNEVRAMIYDPKEHQVIIGNKRGDLYFYDVKLQRLVQSRNLGGRIYGLTKAANGDIWVSNKDNGLQAINPATSNVRRLEGLTSDAVYATVEDHGHLLVATYGGGVQFVVDGKRVDIKDYPRDTYNRVRTICHAPGGQVWAGSTDGIICITTSGREASAAPLRQTSNPREQLGNNDIIEIKQASDGSMWIATNGGGLSHTIGQDKHGGWRFETFNEKDGLESDEIRAITFAPDGVVWFATDQGICSCDPRTRLITAFSIQDGVGGVACSEAAGLTLPDGQLLFGTLNGIYVVDRKQLVAQKGSTLRLEITDFFVNDQLMSPSRNNVFDYYVPDSGFVELPSRSSTFAVRFASLNYQLQHRVHYQYMLDGFDKEWRNADKSQTASYNNVPAGTYQFKVKAFLSDSPDQSDEQTLTIVVPPFWLFSTTAFFCYALLLLAALISYVQWKRRQRQRHEAEIRKMRVLKIGPEEVAFQQQDDYEFVKQQLDWLEQHYSDSTLRIEDMVAQSHLSRTSFYNQLKSLTGLSPKEFVSDFRLKKAAMYLEKDNCTIAEVAYKTGFNDPVYFARIFKQKMGVTPTQHRENTKKQDEGETGEDK